jgi:hypothetical protein
VTLFLEKFQNRELNLWQLAVNLVVATFCIYIYNDSAVHHYVESRLSSKIFFSVRNKVRNDLELHPRLKMYSFDDSSLSTLQAPDLPLKTWVEILEALDRKKPDSIYIDAIFSMTPDAGEDKQALLQRLAAIKTPIITAAFVAGADIKGRPKLSLDSPLFRIRDLFYDDYNMLVKPFPPFTDRLGWFAYGPAGELMPYFRMQGHVINADGGYVSSLLQLTPKAAIPHISLIGSKPMTIIDGSIYGEKTRIPTTKQGEILVDFLSPSLYYKKSRRILGLINSSRASDGVREVEAGDVVLLMPAMYTGSVDFTESPVGKMPGAFVIASMLNSRLNKKWYSYHDALDGVAYIGLAGALVAMFVPTSWVFPVFLISLLATAATTIALFVWFSVVTSLSAGFVAVAAFASAVVFQKFHLLQRMNRLLRFLRDENTLMQAELQQANEISRVFVPSRTPAWDGLEIGTYHKPMTLGSGDWYTFELSASGKHLHYIMCDISGHGVQAAIIVSTCKTVMSMLTSEQPQLLESPAFIDRYIEVLNKTLHGQGGGRHTATLAAVSYTRGSSQVRVVVCGHPRPILFQAGQKDKPRFVGLPSNIVGFSRDLKIRATSFEMNKGDGLLIYTDGVEFPRVLTKVIPFYQRYRHVDANTAAKFIVADMDERQKNFESYMPDDVSLVWFRCLADGKQTEGTSGVDSSKAV